MEKRREERHTKKGGTTTDKDKNLADEISQKTADIICEKMADKSSEKIANRNQEKLFD